VASQPNIIYADLDSFRDFDDSGFISQGFDFEVPTISLRDVAGLGVEMIDTAL
jgi:hypothetical protein